jgi:hypothetical protein
MAALTRRGLFRLAVLAPLAACLAPVSHFEQALAASSTGFARVTYRGRPFVFSDGSGTVIHLVPVRSRLVYAHIDRHGLPDPEP